jgi:hypothetical protein
LGDGDQRSDPDRRQERGVERAARAAVDEQSRAEAEEGQDGRIDECREEEDGCLGVARRRPSIRRR